MISVAIAPEQIGAVGGLRRRPGAQPGGGLGKRFRLGAQRLLEDGAVFGLSGVPRANGPLLEGMDQTIVEPSNDKLAHVTSVLLSSHDSRKDSEFNGRHAAVVISRREA
jgi:hypothetical protein